MAQTLTTPGGATSDALGGDETSSAGERLAAGAGGRRGGLGRALRPMALDFALPMGCYYLLHSALGLGEVLALALSGGIPAVRTVAELVRDRRLNGQAALMLAVNVAGIVLSFTTGDARMMIAKDSALTSVVGLAMLGSAFTSRPLMSMPLRLWVTRGVAAKEAAWDRLSSRSPRFRRAERVYTAVWGVTLTAECLVRLACAFTLPVSTMVWLSNVIFIVATAFALVASGLPANPIMSMVRAESR
ncbi:VC0807 family protein [Microbispora sp. NPDC049125]|uniref:VC0807 family protein n=1 Tax=Microbispora sp. NPDC049125 TaxID=3154929 RepID=UPI003467E41C